LALRRNSQRGDEPAPEPRAHEAPPKLFERKERRRHARASILVRGMAKSLVLYDGVCGLCNRLNQFVLARDKADHFRFAPLQGPLAAKLLAARGKSAAELDTVYVVADWEGTGERLLHRA